MDAFGHINNVVFVRYLEEARIAFLFNQAAGAGVGDFARGAVVARHEIDYVRPLVYRPEPVTIESWVTRLGAASFTVRYEIKDTDEDGRETVYVRASTVVVPYDLAAGRPRRISPAERAFLVGLTDDDGDRKVTADRNAAGRNAAGRDTGDEATEGEEAA
jgi:acyl-CoA thioester hydrolase